MQEYWSELPFLSPGDLPDPGIKPKSPALQADSLPTEPPGNSRTYTHTHTHTHTYIHISPSRYVDIYTFVSSSSHLRILPPQIQDTHDCCLA